MIALNEAGDDRVAGERAVGDYKPLSECALWELQRRFFTDEGIDAWDAQVPFYITSNPAIANGYATMMLRFMQDWSRCPAYNAAEPFYLIELGAGSGRFGFYAVRRLLELREQLGLEALRFCYVLTDFAAANVDYWPEHPAWQPFIEQRCVDFARFDVEHDRCLTLRQSGVTLGQGANAPANPCVFVANYLFDSLPHDLFRLTGGELQIALAGLQTGGTDVEASVEKKATRLEQTQLEFTWQKVDDACYGVEAFDRILRTYRHECGTLDNRHFIFPIGALRCLDHLTSLSQGPYLLLATDKGDCQLSRVMYPRMPAISEHGSISIAVNFHALVHYLRNNGGDSRVPSLRPGIANVALLAGADFTALPETRRAVDDYLGRYSPGVVFTLYSYIRDTAGQCPPDTFVALMILCDWDPHIFNKYFATLLAKLPECSELTRDTLIAGMPAVAGHFYYMPGAVDTLAQIALLLQMLEHYEQALAYYQQSINYFGSSDRICYNCGLCHYYLSEIALAAEQFERALQLNPDLDCARYWQNECSAIQPFNHSTI